MAALTLASAFARPHHIQSLDNYVPKPVRETITAIIESPKELLQPVAETEQIVRVKSVEAATDESSLQKPFVQQLSPQLDSTNRQSQPDTVRMSPSRYMQYEGDKLYWIITPKTSFDDLAIMKQEFERHGYKMQVQTLKYDPLRAYISDIKITIIRPTAGVSDFEETGVAGGPIRSHGGYNGFNTLKTVAAVGSYPFNDDFLHVPQGLVQIARNEELPITKLIHNKKMDSLIAEGERKYGHLGLGFRQFNREEIKKQSRPNSAISVKSDGSIAINETAGWIIKVFINNEPTTLDAVQLLKITQVHTVAVILGYDNAAQKRTGTDYLLFYLDEHK